MANATKCAAPEGNRGRDEWMTVIEMQEYMGASRSKAYDGIVLHDKLVAWIERNSVVGSPRRG
ncbi:hypothetical protein DXD49_09380 [Collinsella sp. TM05-38]|uniref:hypothetical protein n=1 Tax=Collinsella sp. TM05-38 TaxID=2292341 RepID=UPI000E4E27C3|nr:hypothetical protein [Collinsella sp. TM05-38]RGJ67124.1 hypothetical protein DXD49_09380 [Collinsella sp. TM05-38]